MNGLINTFFRRRISNALFATLVALSLLFLLQSQRQHLKYDSFTSGYLLISAVLFLAAYNLRKKLSFLPLGKSSTWLQIHIYVAYVAIVIFLAHVGFRFPNGQLESLLAILFSGTAVSGIYGLYITRVYPKRLSNLSEEFVFERIPAFQYQIRKQASSLAVASMEQVQETTLAEFYSNRLSDFFEQQRGVVYRLFPGSRRRKKLMAELSSLQRYLSTEERQISNQFFRLIRKKDDLDYHWALQGKLKLWLFAHIGLTYSLVLVAIYHAVMAHAFHGGLR